MNLWRIFVNLISISLAPEPSYYSRTPSRKHIAVIAALLGVAAIAGAVVLTPSQRDQARMSGKTCASAFPNGRKWICLTISARAGCLAERRRTGQHLVL